MGQTASANVYSVTDVKTSDGIKLSLSVPGHRRNTVECLISYYVLYKAYFCS